MFISCRLTPHLRFGRNSTFVSAMIKICIAVTGYIVTFFIRRPKRASQANMSLDVA